MSGYSPSPSFTEASSSRGSIPSPVPSRPVIQTRLSRVPRVPAAARNLVLETWRVAPGEGWQGGAPTELQETSAVFIGNFDHPNKPNQNGISDKMSTGGVTSLLSAVIHSRLTSHRTWPSLLVIAGRVQEYLSQVASSRVVHWSDLRTEQGTWSGTQGRYRA
ncbi:hypothetical protein RRG08_061363 [Elysia crispata]|uniref:Uncharacterized protein n=1 Tax=Elysia crispata TaxID=231223 RepID=A0AAE1DXY2_9GAST|nr:hypothetical protein RRG08_061363 [Elysia crispata]